MNSPVQTPPGEQQYLAANDTANENEARDGARNGASNGTEFNSSRLPLETFEELQIPDRLRTSVEQELTAGEKMLWLGRPSDKLRVQIPKPVFLAASLGLMGLGLLIV